MATYYALIQYVPDPFADERINLGVVVWGDGRIRCRFTRDWQRVRRFGAPDVTTLRDFAQRLQDASDGVQPLVGIPGLERFDEAALEDAIRSWAGVIQFSQPRASLRDPDAVLEDVARRALRGVGSGSHRRGRNSVAAMVQREVQRAVEARAGQRARELVLKGHRLAGRSDDHRIDVLVANGVPHLAAHGLSFETLDVSEILHNYNDIAWAVSDVRRRQPNLPFAVAVYPPPVGAATASVELFRRAERVFPREGALLLEEGEVDDWTEDVLAKVPNKELGLLG